MSEAGKSSATKKSNAKSFVAGNSARSMVAAVGVVAVGLVVAATILRQLGQRQQAAAAIPFVVTRVMVMHLLCVLPLTAWFAWRGGRRVAPPIASAVGWASVFSGVAAGVLIWITGPMIAQVAAGAGPVGCDMLRLGVAAILMAPWAAAAVAVLRSRRFTYRAAWVDGLIGVLVLCLPVIHVQQVGQRLSQVVADELVNQQFARAERNGWQLVAMGRPLIGDQQAGDVLIGLQQRLAAYSQQASVPLADDATPEQRIDRARLLFGLGQHQEATRLLTPLSDEHPEAGVRMGLVLEVDGRFTAAADRYRDVIERLSTRRPLDPRQLSLLRISLERRANNLRRANDSLRAESELKAALERWPEVKAAVLMQLGFHYQMAGRTGESMAAFEQAVQLDPALETQVTLERQKLKAEAQGCTIRLTRGVTR